MKGHTYKEGEGIWKCTGVYKGKGVEIYVFIVHVLYGLSLRTLTWPISCTKGAHIWEPKEKMIIGAVPKHGVILILGESSIKKQKNY